ncbi:MAG: leucine-rich repeat domain-containing protein [Clostridia bacterium]|nr:leucine-rich repeat domain-containing protein [Clostridia bacterium]
MNSVWNIRISFKRKRFVAALLVVLLILPAALLFSSCEADFVPPEGEIEYVLDDRGSFYNVASCGTYTGSKVVIPAEINGLPVKSIDPYAFAYNKYIEEVVLPDTIITIGQRAFYHCVNLKKINFPEKLWSIHDKAFEGCRSLENVSLSRTVSLRSNAFAYCDNLGEIEFYGEKPTGGDLIGVESMHRVGTTMVLNRYADKSSVDYFKNNPKITAIEVLEENKAFSAYDGVLYNKNFTELVRCPEGKTGTLRIPATVTSIDYFAFYNCTGIEAIVVEDGNTAFKVIDNVLYTMDESQIMHCSSKVKTLKFFANTTYLHGDNLVQLSNVNEFEVHPDNQEISSKDGLLLSKDGTILIMVPPAKTGTFTVPEYIKSVSDSAFYGSSLSKIVFKNGIDNEILGGCFANCASLKSVVLPENITGISDETFIGCVSLETVNIPKSVIYIGVKAFSDCFSLKKVEFEDETGWYLVEQYYGTPDLERHECDIPVDVSDARMAAWYLQHAYWRYDWEKISEDVSPS